MILEVVKQETTSRPNTGFFLAPPPNHAHYAYHAKLFCIFQHYLDHLFCHDCHYCH